MPAPGDVLRVPGFVAPPPGYDNPGADRLRQAWLARGRVGRLSVNGEPMRKAPTAASASQSLSSTFQRAMGRVRTRLALALADGLPGRAGGVLRALGLGDRGGVDADLRRMLRDSGTAHILAVSGAHVGLVVALMAALLRLLIGGLAVGLLRRGTFWQLALVPCLAAAWFYVLITGAAPSTQRAALMATFALMIRAAASRFDLAETLGFAALLLALLEPEIVQDVGLQLSLLGVLGVALGHRLALRLAGDDRRPGWLLRAFGVSAGAAAATSLVAIPVFGQLPLLAPLANILIVPWVGVVLLPLALLVVAWFAACTWLGSATHLAVIEGLSTLADLAIAPLDAAVQAPAWLFPAWQIGGLQAAFIAVLVPVCAAGLLVVRHKALWSVTAVVVALVVGPVIALSSAPAPASFEAWFLDVGHGDAIVLKMPDGQVIVVDGGGETGDDGRVGERAVLPALRQLGVSRIDVMVMTHPHPDHENGLLALARSLRVRELWWTGDHAAGAEHRELIDTLRRQGTRWRRLDGRADDHCTTFRHGEVTIRVVWPVALGAHGADGANDRSVVLEVATGRHRLLLTGDIEVAAERALLALPGALRPVAVLKAPHHGSTTSSTRAFLRQLSPMVAVAGARSWGQLPFPHPAIRRRYEDMGIRLWATEHGAVRLRMSSSGWCMDQGARSVCSDTARAPERR